MLHIISSIIVGFFVGLIARALLPGDHQMGFWATVLIGIVGSVVGGLIARIFSRPRDGALFHPAGFLLSIIGAIIVLVVYSMMQRPPSRLAAAVPSRFSGLELSIPRSNWIVFSLVVLAAVLVGGWFRANYDPEWKPGREDLTQPWAAEADCYSQLARVHRIQHGQGLIQNHFAVENWPDGLIPSTTATFDYAMLALEAPLSLVTKHPLDWAGALISPALALALILFWCFCRSAHFSLVSRAVLVVGFALAPPLIWGTAFGRPRHQSLILACLGLALVAEYERWSKGRSWHIAAGLVWGLLCWTSLYEPLFALLLLVIFNLVVRRREQAAFAVSFGVVMLIALLVEGIHVFIPSPEQRPVLTRWLQFIAEMRGMSYQEFFNVMTFSSSPGVMLEFGGFLAAIALIWMLQRLLRSRNPADWFLIILTLSCALLALFQKRWLPYASLGEVFLIARYFQSIALQGWPLIGWRSALALLLVANLLASDRAEVHEAVSNPPNQPSAELARLSHAIDQPGGIMAPWWLSPGLLYFSGQPIVSGSSHCGISGIAASARFYTATSWPQADQILRERQVRWIVVWDDPTYVYPLLGSSQEILGLPVSTDQNKGDADRTVAQILVNDQDLPANLRLRAVTSHLKLYEVVAPGEASTDHRSIETPVAVR